jgi:hypothetical protein
MPTVLTQAESRCGLVSASSTEADDRHAAACLARQLAGRDIQQLLVFFSAERCPTSVASALAQAFPDVPIAGCSTAGELMGGEMVAGSITVLGFARDGFRVVCELIPNIDELTVERAFETGRRIRSRLDISGLDQRMRDRCFAMVLVDGLSNSEEMVVAAAYAAIGDTPLVGGSAGDGLSFRQTALLFNGEVLQKAAVLLMVETDHVFRTFKTQNFQPTERRLVVTAADTARRIVHELNAAPAAQEYAEAIGIRPEDLSPIHFADNPVTIRAGSDHYCRAIRQADAQGGLSFFCAIDEGIVLTVAKQQDMAQTTIRTFEHIEQQIGPIHKVIAFDCFLRRIGMENRQMTRTMQEIYRSYGLVGFNTYGEQYNNMHLNQTLTGIAIGARRH